mgnify:CR=1 FL=1
MAKRKTVWEDCDILVVGGGMAGTGAAYEARYWGRDMRIICAEKANIDRSSFVLKKQTLIEVELLLKVYMQLTATWECSGMRISLKIT